MQQIPYASMVENIMYVIACSKCDLTYVVSIVCRFMRNLEKPHWQAIKCVFRYLASTTNLELSLAKDVEKYCEFTSFVDSNFVGNIDTRKSLTG